MNMYPIGCTYIRIDSLICCNLTMEWSLQPLNLKIRSTFDWSSLGLFRLETGLSKLWRLARPQTIHARYDNLIDLVVYQSISICNKPILILFRSMQKLIPLRWLELWIPCTDLPTLFTPSGCLYVWLELWVFLNQSNTLCVDVFFTALVQSTRYLY